MRRLSRVPRQSYLFQLLSTKDNVLVKITLKSRILEASFSLTRFLYRATQHNSTAILLALI